VDGRQDWRDPLPSAGSFACQIITGSLVEVSPPAVQGERMMLLAVESAEITTSEGLAIAITGMLIVFTALILISLALVALPRVLVVLHEYYPEKPDHSATAPRRATNDDQEIAAAAAFAMHLHRGGAT
jgi:Na+-transporting methylmalonyl-CoA/oxaloacetate decarboxylase gamma subunit